MDVVTQRKVRYLTSCRGSWVEEKAFGFREVWKVDSAECVDLEQRLEVEEGTTESRRVSLWPFF